MILGPSSPAQVAEHSSWGIPWLPTFFPKCHPFHHCSSCFLIMYFHGLYPLNMKVWVCFLKLFNKHLMVDGREGGQNLLGTKFGSKGRKCVAIFEMVFQRKTCSSETSSDLLFFSFPFWGKLGLLFLTSHEHYAFTIFSQSGRWKICKALPTLECLVPQRLKEQRFYWKLL